MRCPYCGSLDDKVLESRTMANGESIRRRRECVSCGFRFTSYERIEEKPFMVVKRDGRRQPYDRTKLEKGIERALEKRPVAYDTKENILNDIEDQAIMKGRSSREISTSELGEIVLERLYETDKVAYIRFASVYRHFEDLDEFIKEARKIKRDKGLEKSEKADKLEKNEKK
ncbi:MAG: transcriptional regulator NrdR [Treponema sp.]|nr:transcriptional regulator NrdR [Treponema sp.]